MGYSAQELADRAEIQDVIVRYGWAIDTKDWDLLDTCFTADGAPVPPTFPFVMPYWGSLGEGGAAGLPIENLRGKGRAILHGEQEFIYHGGAWPHVGDTLVGDGQISDVYEKEKSSGGKLEFYVTETTWKNEQTGEPVVTTKFTLAINCKADAAEPKPLS